jgi:PIN domain nuclease of toxin-antitoxin system
MKYVLDTHAWIWWNARPEALSKKARERIAGAKAGDELLLPAIAVWEFCKLLEVGRLAIASDAAQWIKAALDMPRLRLAPLTPEIALASTTLPGQFHSDPADQIIVATARVEQATLITRDERIRRYPHVQALW